MKKNISPTKHCGFFCTRVRKLAADLWHNTCATGFVTNQSAVVTWSNCRNISKYSTNASVSKKFTQLLQGGKKRKEEGISQQLAFFTAIPYLKAKSCSFLSVFCNAPDITLYVRSEHGCISGWSSEEQAQSKRKV